MSRYIRYPSITWQPPVANAGALPTSATAGDARVTLDTNAIYVYGLDNAWHIISGGGGGGDSFYIMQTPLGTSPTATSATDILTWANSDGLIDITGNSATDTIDLTLDLASFPLSSGSTTGFLSSTDWTTFNNKQTAGNYITGLTGDGTASGPGSVALTLATVNGSPGSFGSAADTLTATVNGKGLVTALSATPIAIAQSQVTNLVTDLGNKADFSFVTINTDSGTDPVADSISDTLNITSVILDVNGNSTTDTITLQSKAEFDAGNSGTSKTITWTDGPAQKVTLTGNVTFTLSSPQSGTAYVLRILSGAGGFTAAWPASVKWPGGAAPTITTTASRMDLINLYYDGTNYYGSFAQDYTP